MDEFIDVSEPQESTPCKKGKRHDFHRAKRIEVRRGEREEGQELQPGEWVRFEQERRYIPAKRGRGKWRTVLAEVVYSNEYRPLGEGLLTDVTLWRCQHCGTTADVVASGFNPAPRGLFTLTNKERKVLTARPITLHPAGNFANYLTQIEDAEGLWTDADAKARRIGAIFKDEVKIFGKLAGAGIQLPQNEQARERTA